MRRSQLMTFDATIRPKLDFAAHGGSDGPIKPSWNLEGDLASAGLFARPPSLENPIRHSRRRLRRTEHFPQRDFNCRIERRIEQRVEQRVERRVTLRISG